MAERPNILLLFTDDQRFDTIAALGNSRIQTPNLDRLVERGVTFTHAHIPGGTSGAVCMPSRAMLHTGRQLFHLQGAGESIPTEHILLGEHLKASGYQTFGTGKWHNGKDAFARSFCDGAEIFFGGMADHWNVPAHHYDPDGLYEGTCPIIADPIYSKEVTHRACDHIHSGKHSTDLLSEAASEWIRSYDQDAPFFAYVSFLAPHDPRSMPPRYQALYDPKNVELPPNWLPEHPFSLGTREIRDELLALYPRTEDELREHIADYYAMITHLDDRIGDLFAALEDSGQAENTVVVFAGDNGLAVGQHGLLGKQSLYDHSVRVPLIFAGPGVPEYVQRDDFCCLYQIYATLCDLAGVETPGSVEGDSLAAAFCGDQVGGEELYLAYTELHRAVRTRQHKLICCRVDGQETVQLFDLAEDPYEMDDLSESQPELRDALYARLVAASEESGEMATPWGRRFWGE